VRAATENGSKFGMTASQAVIRIESQPPEIEQIDQRAAAGSTSSSLIS
jgi:hypothetical protein